MSSLVSTKFIYLFNAILIGATFSAFGTLQIPPGGVTNSCHATVNSFRIKNPRGTIYWGGAGLGGPYVEAQLVALRGAGIRYTTAGLSHTATSVFGPRYGTMLDAARAGLFIRYEDDGDWHITATMSPDAPQFNLIGYSYGSLLAAQTAHFYASKGINVDHVVLIGSPIDQSFLTSLRANKNIGKVIVVNLTEHGDGIYAGIPQMELILKSIELDQQMAAKKGQGHFYYAHVIPESKARWNALAQQLYQAGLR